MTPASTAASLQASHTTSASPSSAPGKCADLVAQHTQTSVRLLAAVLRALVSELHAGADQLMSCRRCPLATDSCWLPPLTHHGLSARSFVFMHEAVDVARGGALAGLRKELLMPPAGTRRVLGSPVQVCACATKASIQLYIVSALRPILVVAVGHHPMGQSQFEFVRS